MRRGRAPWPPELSGIALLNITAREWSQRNASIPSPQFPCRALGRGRGVSLLEQARSGRDLKVSATRACRTYTRLT